MAIACLKDTLLNNEGSQIGELFKILTLPKYIRRFGMEPNFSILKTDSDSA
jgi:hypothetical protein